MTTPPVGVERRAGQRFAFLLPVSFREISTGVEGVGFTQDLSSRGVFFLTDAPLNAGAGIEITLNMPSEITLGETMRVRCRGHILRIVRPVNAPAEFAGRNPATRNETHPEPRPETSPETRPETKIGVAVRLEGYEYLPESPEASATFQRVSALHSHSEKEHPVETASAVRSVLI